MRRYIDAEYDLHDLPFYYDFSDEELSAIHSAMRGIPTADVVEVVHGKWVPTRKESDISFCSNCESYWIIRDDAYDYMYCPKCGAKMEV